ncbi:putative membrane protein YphA (DoxX/SURF4 family) [Lysinibacillus sp. TE18511]
MVKKNTLYILILMIGIFVFNGILKWLNIPTYDQILETMLGKPDTSNIFIALIITGILIYLIIFGISKPQKFFRKR